MITLTYGGSTRVVPRYNVMGVAKAALEASVRYLAMDFGPVGIRVNGLSPGPMRTLAGAGISDARVLFNFQKMHSPLGRTPSLDEVGGAALYLLSDLSTAVTGEIHYVDSGLQYRRHAAPGNDQRDGGRDGDRVWKWTAFARGAQRAEGRGVIPDTLVPCHPGRRRSPLSSSGKRQGRYPGS